MKSNEDYFDPTLIMMQSKTMLQIFKIDLRIDKDDSIDSLCMYCFDIYFF